MSQSGFERKRPAVCLLTETFYPVVGGGETQSRLLADGLTERGFDVFVLTRRSGRDLPRHERLGRLDVHRLPPSGPGRWKKWGLILTSVPALIRNRKKFDVMLVSGYRIVGMSAVPLARILGKPCVLKSDSPGELSGEFFRRGLRSIHIGTSSLLFRAFISVRNSVLRRASAFVAISSQIRDEYISHGIEPQQVHAIPNGIDMTIFGEATSRERADLRRKLGIDESSVVGVYTGRLVSYKGLPLLLEVWERLAREYPHARLFLVGPGGLDMHNCEPELRDFVSSRDLINSVLFAGSVGNVHEYLQAADYFVFPTETEAFGISLVEAMACGLPPVTTHVGGIRDIVEPDRTGLTVEVGDARSLHSAMRRMIEDAPLRQALGAAARLSVSDRFSLTSVVDQYEALFRALIGRTDVRVRPSPDPGTQID